MHASSVKRQGTEIDMRLSLIDARTFRFMVDEVPNFSTYILRVLARRIRGLSKVM